MAEAIEDVEIGGYIIHLMDDGSIKIIAKSMIHIVP